MEKRGPKSPAIIEPNQVGCVWRFSGMFDYHQTSTNQKLLLDRGHGIKTLPGLGYPRNQVKLLTDSGESCKGTNIEPKHETILERGTASLKCVNLQKKARKDARILVGQLSSCPIPMEISSHDEGFCNKIPQRNERRSSSGKTKQERAQEKNLQLVQMSAETFIDQMFVDGKYLRRDRASHQSRQFLDALEILSKNKELFLKLLQDPNSLLVKHIQSLRVELSKQHPEAQERKNERQSTEIYKQSEEKSLWKRLKSRYDYPNKKNANSHSLEKIVVLKPGKKSTQKPVDVGCSFSYLQPHHHLTSKEQITKETHFSFSDIRQKLRHSRKLKGASTSTSSERENEKSKSANSKSSIRASEVVDIGKSASKSPIMSTVVYAKRQELDIFAEARRHLSERLRQVEKGETSSKEASRTLERVLLSSPKHDFLGTLAPKREGAQMRFSPCGYSQVAGEGSLQNLKVKKLNEPIISSMQSEEIHFQYEEPVERLQNLDLVREMERTDSFMTEDSSSSGYLEIIDTNDFLQTGDGCLEGSRMESHFKNASSANTSRVCKLEITDSDQERGENPSPVSVLDSFFIDNVSSPTSTIESVEPPIQPLHLDFEEKSQMVSPPYPKISLHTCMDNEEFISAYVKTVYQTSQSNWEEFLAKGCPRESRDHKLLYDCVKEALVDLHQLYFEFSPWKTFMISHASLEKELLGEVMERVNWYNLPLLMPRTLDQIVGRDIAKSGQWIDTRLHSEDIVVEVVEEALEQLIRETILDIHL